MKRFLLLLSCSGALLRGADLASVRTVYVMPMSHGLDQHLANRLTNNHVFQVVADPKLADAIFTDRIGEAFRVALEEISPTPKPEAEEEKPKKDAADAKGKDAKEEQTEAPAGNSMLADFGAKTSDPGLMSTFGRGKGTLFLVDAKSRDVVWSTFEAPGSSTPKVLDRTASDIVSRLKKDLKLK